MVSGRSTNASPDCHCAESPEIAHERDHIRHGEHRRLGLALAVAAVVLVIEAAVGLWSNSLALLGDAGHVLADSTALILSMVALKLASLPADRRRTYGFHRLEILAALTNGVLLVAIALVIVVEAVQRFLDPVPIKVVPMLAVAVFGLVANLLSLWLLHDEHHHSINMRSAFLHVLGDTASSVGVVAGGVIVYFTGITYFDPAISLLIAAVIVVSALRLLGDVVNVLLEAVPVGLDCDAIQQAMLAVPGVAAIHDLHVWSITSGMPALSAHIVTEAGVRHSDELLIAVKRVLLEHFDIDHTTLQIESPGYEQAMRIQ